MNRLALMLALMVQALLALPAAAHEMRPAYLDMRETAANEFAIVWKVPARGDMRLGLYLRLPAICKPAAEPVRTIEGSAYMERWSALCNGGLRGQEVTIDGLSATLTDALARIAYLDGSVEIERITPDAPSFVIAGAQSAWDVSRTYFTLGVEHILSGFDHLLFVLALVLLIRDRWLLVKTITAFTIAHSITLAGASLGYFSLPQKPVEAAIALSIAFVASELAKAKSGERRTFESHSWVVAFAFGLLHGFGFAGALREIGLPQTDVPLALLTFNLGVEAGQLMFIAALLIAFKAISALFDAPLAIGRRAAAYSIGTISMVWFVSRMSSF